MKSTLLSFFLAFVAIPSFSQLNMQLLDQMGYPVAVNDVWGWADPVTNAEYAIVGLNTGVSIVDVTTPTNIVEVQFISGPNSTWRDIKSWGNHVYVTNETGGGLLVVDMSGAPDNITWEYVIFPIPGWGDLTDCHNLYIDEFGYCYLAGCNLNAGRMLTILDVFTDPGNPTVVYSEEANYAHDYFAQDNILYASEIYGGDLGIYDVTNKQSINLLASQPTPYNFTHNAWVNTENTVVFTTDEKANAPVAAYDITDLNDIRELDQFRPINTLGANVIPHNVHVWDNWLIISYYTDGGIIADASRPDNIIEVGNWDSFLGGNGGYNGAWGAYPFLPSGIVLLSDRQSGLVVCGANYVRACWLEGKVTNSLTGANIFGAEVHIESSQANLATSNLVGEYKTGQAIPGTFDVTFSAMGYISKTVTANLENGVLTTLDVQLDPIIAVDEFSGQVVSAIDGTPIAAAQVVLESPTFRFTAFTNAAGQFKFIDIFRDTYTISAAHWGHKHVSISNVLIDQNSDPITLETHLGYQDDFFVSQGWTSNMTASSGWWTRGIPNGTTQNGITANPNADVPNDIGNECFMTGNNGADDEVDEGYVRLTSPVMDLTIYYEPVLSYRTWFVNTGNSVTPPNDNFQVRINNGSEEVVLETITTSNPAWNDRSEFKVSDYITITDQMKIIFEASDQGEDHIVEAAVDAFLVEESAFPTFNYTEAEGCPVLVVNFADPSDLAYEWNWFFENGDPATSNLSNPEAGFIMAGSHDVSLEVLTKTGATFILDYPDLINVLPLPTSDFTFTNTGGEVNFSNASQNALSYFWTFNDGSGVTSDLPNPTHTFSEPGSYDVTLAATNDCGTNYFTQTIVIDAVPPLPFVHVENNVGCGPLTVQFFDDSNNEPTAWQWSFPGGTPATSTEQNPIVTYQTPGLYCIELVVSNSAGTNGQEICDLVEVLDVPTANFDFSVTGPTVVFSNNSFDANTYLWEFNDGSGITSDQINPTHIFSNMGEFEVVLTATNDCGSVSYAQTISITQAQPAALFTADVSEGCAPLTVTYQDLSTGGGITSWEWTFPGGTPATSTEQHPAVTYNDAGEYGATLKVTNDFGLDEVTVSQTISVQDLPVADFSFDANGPTLTFQSLAQNADSLAWHFGDAGNNVSNLDNPSFTYENIGMFTVILEAFNNCGSSSLEQQVNVPAIFPNATLSASNFDGCAPLEVTFTDESTGGLISNYEWSFPGGDPSSSNEASPTVTYSTAGVYDVSLKVTNPIGESETSETGLIIVDDVLPANFDFTTDELTASFFSQNTTGDNYAWDFGDGSGFISNEINPEYVFPDSGQYVVTLTISNPCGDNQFSQVVTITSTTNTRENNLALTEFFAAPNPFSEELKVVYQLAQPFSQGTMTLTNILGEIIISHPVRFQTGQFILGQEIARTGVYFLQLEVDGKRSEVLKVVKI
jgi:choice-of-anchor B domain-containing protein